MAETATIETDQATELTAAQQDEASKGFAEGFASERPTEGTPPATPAGPDPVTTDATDEPEAEPAEPEPKYVQITEAQFAAMNEAATKVHALAATLEKMSGTAFGKIGGLERTLKELQAATPSGQAVEVSEDDFEELKADYPDLAKMQAAGINRAMKKIGLKGTAPAFDETKIAELVGKGKQEVREELSVELMDTLYDEYVETAKLEHDPGWVKLTHESFPESAPYRAWLATQPQEYQDKILYSWKPREILGSIKQFHQFTAEATRKKPGPAVDPGEGRRRRLQQGVQPKSEGAASSGEPSERDGFAAGFKENYRAAG